MNRVEPIRDARKIVSIKNMLKGAERWRDYALFVLGINFGLRIDDLLSLKVKDVLNESGEIKERFTITEGKTKKTNTIKINGSASEALKLLFENSDIEEKRENHLIYNTREPYKPIHRVSAHRLVNKICSEVGIKNIAIGTHSLRKTWGYHAHKEGISIEVIQAKYMHQSTATTRRYLGIEQKDVSEAYDSVNL